MQHSSINLDLERRVLQHIKCDMATSRGQLCSIKNSDARISQIASYVTSWIVQGDITNHLYYDITKSTKWNNKIHGLQQLEIKHATSKVNHLHQPCHARTPSCHRGHHLERFYYCKICNWHGPVKWSSCPTSFMLSWILRLFRRRISRPGDDLYGPFCSGCLLLMERTILQHEGTLEL